MRFGLFCSTKDNSLSTNRSFKLSSLNREKLIDTVKKNLQDLPKLLELCRQRGYTIFRLGNAIVPFASHPEFRGEWWDEISLIFEDIKKECTPYSIRLSIHPGQFVQLGSPNPIVVESSLRELAYCHKVLEMFGSEDGVITLHIGGAHGDKEATMQRFYDVFTGNIWLKKYLALENDEYNFNAEQTLRLAKRCGIGMIFDIFHHSINPSDIEWKSIAASWKEKRPKMHISSQGDGKIGTHAAFINKNDFETLLAFVGSDAEYVDIMVEAKAKEDAIEMLKKG